MNLIRAIGALKRSKARNLGFADMPANCRHFAPVPVPIVGTAAKLRLYSTSARAKRDGDTMRPSALAVLRFMTSPYLVGDLSSGSAGFSPVRRVTNYFWRARWSAL
jgi:hypothetical protein